MFIADTGQLAMSFNEEGINTSGSLTKALRVPPQMSIARKRAEKTILALAKKDNVPVGVIVSKVMANSIPELQSFVQARGETPSTKPTSLALQAALLRATEIGLVAKTLDTDDAEALRVIEESEEQHVDDNSAESSSILSPDTAGALALMVYRLSNTYKEKGGSGNMCDFVSKMKIATGADNFDTISCAYVADNATGGGGLFYTPDQEQDVLGTYTGVDNGPKPSTGGFWDNLFSGIDKVVAGITKVTGAVNTTVGNVGGASGGILDQITNIGGEVGTKSIDGYIKENWLKIVGVVLALIIITILLLRVTNRK